MNMQKSLRLPFFLVLLLAVMLLLPSFSLAGSTVVTPMALPFNPASPCSAYVNARILAYEEPGEYDYGYLTLQLSVPERYARDDVLNLKAGDAIYARGRELQVGLVEIDDGDELYAPMVFISPETDDPDIGTLWMMADADGNYHYTVYEEIAMVDLEPIRVPFNPDLSFIDEFDSAAVDGRPVVHTADEFLDLLSKSDPDSESGFASGYISVVFDAHGSLVLICRGY